MASQYHRLNKHQTDPLQLAVVEMTSLPNRRQTAPLAITLRSLIGQLVHGQLMGWSK
ncbi:hypothetical protein J6590_080056 [Homalodisca vitripennis]|nr:hypothetical protein J6590_080056 [Homalodisca vitripennis]